TSTKHSVETLRREFFHPPLVSLAILAAIHVVPKPPFFGLFNFLLTCLYFSALLFLVLTLDVPRRRYLELLFAARFREATQGIEQAWRQYLTALADASYWPVKAALGLAASTAVLVLSHWLTPLVPLRLAANLVWWGSVLVVAAFPFLGRELILRARQRH